LHVAIAGVGVKGAADDDSGARRRRCTVIGFVDVVGGNSQQGRIDRAAGVIYIGNDVVVPAVTIVHDDAGDGNCLAGSRVRIGVGKRAAAQGILLVTIAGVGVKRAAGNHGGACCGQRAVVCSGNGTGTYH